MSTDTYTCWWDPELDSDERADLVSQRIEDLAARMHMDTRKLYGYAQLYCQFDPVLHHHDEVKAKIPEVSDATKNLIRASIHTFANMIGKQKPLPKVLTNGAPWAVQLQASAANNFLRAAFEQAGVYRKDQTILRDAAALSKGILRAYVDEKKGLWQVKRCLLTSFLVDEELCIEDGEPPELFYRDLVLRSKLASEYPDWEGEIEEAAGVGESSYLIQVYEGWYLGPDTRRYVKWFSGGLLEDMEYPEELDLPFVFLDYNPRFTGWIPQGMAEELEGVQRRINYMYGVVTAANDRFLNPTVYLDNPSAILNVVKHPAIGNVVVNNTGKPPVVTMHQAASPEFYAFLERLEASSGIITGVNQATAQGDLPTYVGRSAPSVREHNVKEMGRFYWQANEYNEMHIKLAHLCLSQCAYATANGTKLRYQTKQPGGEPITVDFRELDWQHNKFILELDDGNWESTSLSNRLENTMEMLQSGMVTPKEGRKLLAHPDLKRADYFNNAAREYAEWVLDRLLNGDPVSPMSYEDPKEVKAVLTAGIQRVTMNMQLSEAKRAEIVARIDAYLIQQDQQMQQQEMAAQMQQMEAMAAQPVPAISNAAAQGLQTPNTIDSLATSRDNIK